MNKQIGKVFETDTYCTKCDCGEVVTQQNFGQMEECGKKIVADCFIGFCKCGNIFVSMKPQKLEKEIILNQTLIK